MEKPIKEWEGIWIFQFMFFAALGGASLASGEFVWHIPTMIYFIVAGMFLAWHWMNNIKTKTKIAETEVGKNPEYYQRTIDFHIMNYRNYCEKYNLKWPRYPYTSRD